MRLSLRYPITGVFDTHAERSMDSTTTVWVRAVLVDLAMVDCRCAWWRTWWRRAKSLTSLPTLPSSLHASEQMKPTWLSMFSGQLLRS